MRFNQSLNRETDQMADKIIAKKSSNKVFKILFIVIILGLVIAGFWYTQQKKKSFVVYDATASPYYAVFLTNGQVYFGRPVSKSRSEFVLSDVYYLQVSGDETPLAEAQSSEQRFALVKLGQEIHGPTDRLFINNQNVLFYEQLSKESKVVQSIADRQ